MNAQFKLAAPDNNNSDRDYIAHCREYNRNSDIRRAGDARDFLHMWIAECSVRTVVQRVTSDIDCADHYRVDPHSGRPQDWTFAPSLHGDSPFAVY